MRVCNKYGGVIVGSGVGRHCALPPNWCGASSAAAPSGPTPEEVEQERVDAMTDANEKGIYYFEHHKWDLAIQNFEEALEYSPYNPSIKHNIQRAREEKTKEEQEARDEEERRRRAAEEQMRLEQQATPTPAPRATPQPSPNMPQPITRAELQAKIEAAKAEIKGLQQALLRLQHSHLNTAKERVAWNTEMVNAGNRAAWHLLDMTTAGLIAHLETQYSGLQSELSDAATKLAGETDPDRRAQLHSAISMMERRKEELTPVMQRLEKESAALHLAKLVKAFDDGDTAYQIALDQTHAGLGKLLTNPALRRKLELLTGSGTNAAFAKGAAGWLSVGKDVLDSSYDLSCSLVALHKMNTSLAREDAEYKHAVDLLKVRVEKTVSSLNNYKRQMQLSSATAPSSGVTKNVRPVGTGSTSQKQQAQ